MWILMLRHLRATYRDRMALFLSLLGTVMFLGLQLLFLGKSQEEVLRTITGQSATAVHQFVSLWLLGIVATVTSVTTVVAIFATYSDDLAHGKFADFRLVGTRPLTLQMSYVCAGSLFGFVVTTVLVAVSGFALLGTALLTLVPLTNWLALLGWIAVNNVLTACAMLIVCRTLARSTRSFTGISTLIGTLVGFISGGYVGFSGINGTLGNILQCLPTCHVARLAKSALMSPSRADFFGGHSATAYDVAFNNQLVWGNGTSISMTTSCLIIGGWAVCLFLAACRQLRK